MRSSPMACVLVLATLVPMTALAAGRQANAADRLDVAIEALSSPNVSDRECQAGMVALLDAIVAAAPAARTRGGWPEKVVAARTLAAGGHMVGAEVATLLNDSYRAVHGKAFALPEAARSPDTVRGYLRSRLSSVRSVLAERRFDEAVRRMLEAAVLIVTPVVVQ